MLKTNTHWLRELGVQGRSGILSDINLEGYQRKNKDRPDVIITKGKLVTKLIKNRVTSTIHRL